MEKLKVKIDELEQALQTLEDAFHVRERVKKLHDESVILAVQDSIIKCFEYTYDCFWKVLKLFLEESFNLDDVNSPKSVFRASVKHGTLNEAEGAIALDMVGDRNETSHRYDHVKAHEISNNVQQYYELMNKITEQLKQKNK